MEQRGRDKQWCIIGPLKHKAPSMDHSTCLLFVDGGRRFIDQYPRENIKFFIGDHDSTSPGEGLHWDCLLPENKDQSDLAVALDHLSFPTALMHFHGFIGGSLDHQLAVFGEIIHYVQKRPIGELILFSQKLHPSIRVLSPGQYQLIKHQRFSLLSLKEQTVVLGGSIKYSGKHRLKPLSSLGLGNEAQGAFTIQCQHPLMIVDRDENQFHN